MIFIPYSRFIQSSTKEIIMQNLNKLPVLAVKSILLSTFLLGTCMAYNTPIETENTCSIEKSWGSIAESQRCNLHWTSIAANTPLSVNVVLVGVEEQKFNTPSVNRYIGIRFYRGLVAIKHHRELLNKFDTGIFEQVGFQSNKNYTFKTSQSGTYDYHLQVSTTVGYNGYVRIEAKKI